METLLILLIIVVWITLYSHISKMNVHTDMLRKDIFLLKKYIETQLEELKRRPPEAEQPVEPLQEKPVEPSAPVVEKPAEPIPAPLVEEYHIPILSVEWREEEKPEPVAETAIPEQKPEQEPEQEQEPIPEPEPAVKPEPEKEEVKVVPPPVIKPFGLVEKKKKVNYEKYIGENLFGKIGILVLVIGIGLFVKYAIDNEWINEVVRTILGFVVGAVLLVISHRLKENYRTFSSLLAGGGFAIFYVTVGIAYHYYGLFSQAAAFVILVVLTVLMSALAVAYNRRELAIIALVGGFISPFLVSNGMGNYLVLFTYMTILNMGMFGLSLYKKWGELPVISFVASYIIMLGYSLVADLDIAPDAKLVHLLLFSTLFYLVFLLPIVSILRTGDKKANRPLMLIVVLNNFVYLFFALWYLRELALPINLKGAFTLFIALVNACLALVVRQKQLSADYLFTVLIGMALTFVSITIPIQLDGSFITLLWATEMVVVLWLFTKFRQRVYSFFALAIFILTVFSFLMDMEKALAAEDYLPLMANGTFATGIFTGLAFGLFAWLIEREKELFSRISNPGFKALGVIALFAGCGTLYITFIVEFTTNIQDVLLSAGLNRSFTCLTLLLLLAGLRKRFPMERYSVAYAIGVGLAGIMFIRLSRMTNGSIEAAYLSLQWLTLALVVLHLFLFARWYYLSYNFRQKTSDRMTSYLAIVSTILLAVAANNLLYPLGLSSESSAVLSISLSLAGFVQMALGMRLHLKIMRMISLCVFALVLLKLAIVDLWLLPTIGKIIVFIMLGVILLVLSFLYQKLKKVLFMDNEEEAK